MEEGNVEDFEEEVDGEWLGPRQLLARAELRHCSYVIMEISVEEKDESRIMEMVSFCCWRLATGDWRLELDT
jgi:hypothetical protein